MMILRRRQKAAMLEGILEMCPDLRNFFVWSYGSPIQTYFSDGVEAAVSYTGVRQGDALGSLFFALGDYAILRNAARLFPDCDLSAYADDKFIHGPPAEAY